MQHVLFVSLATAFLDFCCSSVFVSVHSLVFVLTLCGRLICLGHYTAFNMTSHCRPCIIQNCAVVDMGSLMAANMHPVDRNLSPERSPKYSIGTHSSINIDNMQEQCHRYMFTSHKHSTTAQICYSL